MNKKLDGPEFIEPEKVLDWQPVPGLPEGAWEMILYRDENTGTYARILRLDPGHKGPDRSMTHEFDEVVYNLEGDMVDDITGRVYGPGTYAFFPAGQQHGPYSCPEGNLAIEFRYFKPAAPDADE